MSNDPSGTRPHGSNPTRSIIIMVLIAAVVLIAYLFFNGRNQPTAVRVGSGTAQAMSAASERPQPAQPAPAK